MMRDEYHDTYTQNTMAMKKYVFTRRLSVKEWTLPLFFTFSIKVMMTSFPCPRPIKMNITKRMNNIEGKNSQIDFNKLERIVMAFGIGLAGIMVSYAL